MGVERFEIRVTQTRSATIDMIVEGHGVSPEDKAAAIARVLHRDRWDTSTAEVTSLARVDDHGS